MSAKNKQTAQPLASAASGKLGGGALMRFWRLNPETKKYDIPVMKEVKHPELINRRGYGKCAVCGNLTRSVLDGEAWCDNCERYQ